MSERCRIDTCERPMYGKGLCQMHYARLRRNGHIEKYKRRPNAGSFKRNSSPWNRGVKGLRMSPDTEFQKGAVANEKHPLWSADKVTYFAVHAWVRRHFQRPDTCDFCGRDNVRFHWANISKQYTRDRSDWHNLCVKCHNQYDRMKDRRQIIARVTP
jgi:hypothetical protein